MSGASDDAPDARGAPGRRHGVVVLVMRAAMYLGAGLVISVLVAWIVVATMEQPGTTVGGAFSSYRIGSRVVPERLMRVLPEYATTTYEAAEVGNRAWGLGVGREQIWVRLVPVTPALPYRDPKAGSRFGDGGFAEGLSAPPSGAAARAIGAAAVSSGPSSVPVDLYFAGWPMAALEWTDPEFDRPGMLGLPVFSKFERAWEFGLEPRSLRSGVPRTAGNTWRRMPVRPIGWGLGLIVNAAVWGGILAAGMAAPAVVRRQLRRRRGLCVACAYPVRDERGVWLWECPECGKRTGTGVASGGVGAGSAV